MPISTVSQNVMFLHGSHGSPEVSHMQDAIYGILTTAKFYSKQEQLMSSSHAFGTGGSKLSSGVREVSFFSPQAQSQEVARLGVAREPGARLKLGSDSA